MKGSIGNLYDGRNVMIGLKKKKIPDIKIFSRKIKI